MSSQSVRIIFNPAAAQGRSVALAGRLRNTLATADRRMEIDWVETQHRGHATTLAREAGQAGFSSVVAMGGDGTAHEVVNGLMQIDAGLRPALAIVPIGSGNDFVIGAGLERDPFRALRIVIEHDNTSKRRLDVGLVRDNLGRVEYFINVIGIGLDASVTYHSQNTRFFRGFAMYFAALMRTLTNNYGALPLELQIDRGEFASHQALMLAVANGTREGGGFNITPQADPGDGQLDLAMIGPVSRLRLLRIIPDVMAGTHARHPEISIQRVQHLRVCSSRRLLAHLDGELWAWHEHDVREIEISIVPQAICV